VPASLAHLPPETIALLPPPAVQNTWAYRRLLFLLKRTVESSDIDKDGVLPGYAMSPKSGGSSLTSPSSAHAPVEGFAFSPNSAAGRGGGAVPPSLASPTTTLRQHSLLHAPTSPRAVNVQKALEQVRLCRSRKQPLVC